MIFPSGKNPIVLPSVKRFYGIITSGEIGEETVEFWKLRLQQTLGEIMPYYIQLWETTQVKNSIQYTPDTHAQYQYTMAKLEGKQEALQELLSNFN